MTLPVILVHGFGYDLDPKGSSANQLLWSWEDNLPGINCRHFLWDSGGELPWRIFRAWRNGYRNSYRYVYRRLAVLAARELTKLIGETGRCNIICHSIGSRVALLSLYGAHKYKVQRVLFLNGAESVNRAKATVLHRPDVQFYNAVVENDFILDKLAENFTPGGGIGAIGHDGIYGLPNWFNIELPDSVGHSDSYENSAYWERWRDILVGHSS